MSDPADPRIAATTASLRYLARREHGRGELRHKLLSKGFPESLVDEVLAGLAGEGLQSDVRFAESYVRNRVAQGFGALRIRHELQQRGIDRDALPELGAIDWDGVIGQVHARKYGNTLPESLSERAARERFLAQRGFGYDQIRGLFRRLQQAGND